MDSIDALLELDEAYKAVGESFNTHVVCLLIIILGFEVHGAIGDDAVRHSDFDEIRAVRPFLQAVRVIQVVFASFVRFVYRVLIDRQRRHENRSEPTLAVLVRDIESLKMEQVAFARKAPIGSIASRFATDLGMQFDDYFQRAFECIVFLIVFSVLSFLNSDIGPNELCCSCWVSGRQFTTGLLFG